MHHELHLPADFPQYAWEVEAKGVFRDAQVFDGTRAVPVTFYDMTRLLQDLQDDVTADHPVTITRLIVVDSLTIDQMTAAVAKLPDGFWT